MDEWLLEFVTKTVERISIKFDTIVDSLERHIA